VTAYDPEPWHDLFVMAGGASAALAGLLFVAVSLNTEQILASRSLGALAARAVAILIGLVLVSVAVLIPDQSARRLGTEILVLAILLLLGVVVTGLREIPTIERWHWAAGRIGTSLFATVPLLVAGISLLAEAGGGLYWVVLEVATGLIAGTYNAWVLLVEIRR
jgi:hypothetical protein